MENQPEVIEKLEKEFYKLNTKNFALSLIGILMFVLVGVFVYKLYVNAPQEQFIKGALMLVAIGITFNALITLQIKKVKTKMEILADQLMKLGVNIPGWK